TTFHPPVISALKPGGNVCSMTAMGLSEPPLPALPPTIMPPPAPLPPPIPMVPPLAAAPPPPPLDSVNDEEAGGSLALHARQVRSERPRATRGVMLAPSCARLL